MNLGLVIYFSSIQFIQNTFSLKLWRLTCMASKRKLRSEESLLPASKKSDHSIGNVEDTPAMNELDNSKKIVTSDYFEAKTKSKSKSKSRSTTVPFGWKEQHDNIAKMRSERSAAVDSMGVQSNLTDKFSPAESRFHVLISLVLSSRTRDEQNSAAMDRLRGYGLTVDHIRETSVEDLAKLIYPVGFYLTKARHIKRIVEILHEKYDNDIPKEYEDIIALPGVGPKMTLLLTSVAWKNTVGISVDTHVHRIANRLNWANKTKNPEQTRKALEDWLPREYWEGVNGLLVGFGQQICKPINPLCHTCLNKSICPSSKVKGKLPE